MRSITAYVIIIIFILFSSCKKETDEFIPTDEPILKEGTIQCCFDGVLWETTFTEAFYSDEHGLTIAGNIYTGNYVQDEKLWLHMWGNQDVKNHYLVDFKNKMAFARDITDTSWDYYDTSECYDNYEGELIITELDTINHTISGKFSGNLYQPNCKTDVSHHQREIS
jgi:hypothetical protein